MVNTSYPRTMTPAGERLLNAASELFYRRGIHAVGVDSIAEAAGTTKKTLYDRFGSKDALVALYLQRRVERWQRFVEVYLAERVNDPADTTGDVRGAAVRRVNAVLDALEDWNAELTRGCAFINAYAELGGTDHPGIKVIRTEKEWTRALYARLLREAGAAEALVDRLGTQLAMLQEGALAMWTAGGMDDAVGHARDAGERLLSTAIGPVSSSR